jgi:hypothetical protein
VLTAEFFQSLATPIQQSYGFEVGADILDDMFGYSLYDIHVSPYSTGTAVNIYPPSTGDGQFVDYVHTHPTDVGFSGLNTYWNQQTGLQGQQDYGDIGTSIRLGVGAYVTLPNGSIYAWNYSAFSQAQGSGAWTVNAIDYVRRVK